MAIEFRDEWLESFYVDDRKSPLIPAKLTGALYRKLQIIDAASNEADLRSPPGNRFERLKGSLSGSCSVRVNQKYRLIFNWTGQDAVDVYLDPHRYRG